MIKKVSIDTYAGDHLDMVLREPWDSGFLITSIEGIGPQKAEINMTPYSAYDGERFNSAVIKSRNITMSIRLLEVPTIEDVRHRSYLYFPVKGAVTVTFETDNRTLAIDGYVESNDPDIFSKEESIKVSIICPDPYFYAVDGIPEQIAAIERSIALFEFPFEDYNADGSQTQSTPAYLKVDDDSGSKTLFLSDTRPLGTVVIGSVTSKVVRGSSTDSFPALVAANTEAQDSTSGSIEFELLQSIAYTEFEYQGYADVPMEIRFTFNKKATGDVTVVDAESNEKMAISLSEVATIKGKDLVAGDILRINTKKGEKEATLISGSKVYNCIRAIDKTSDWLTVKRGVNKFGYRAKDYDAFSVTFNFKVVYEGV